MDKLDFAILSLLKEQEAASKLRALSRKDILEIMEINDITLFKRIKRMTRIGYIEEGFKEGRVHTYYITILGKNLLEEALK